MVVDKEMESTFTDEDLKSFQADVTILLNVLGKVVDRESIETIANNPIHVSFHRYMSVFNEMVKNHGDGAMGVIILDFVKSYYRHKNMILNGTESIYNGDIYIGLGEGMENEAKGLEICKIRLSALLRTADKTAKKLENTLSDDEYAKCEAINYPEIIQYHSLKIWMVICKNEDDKKKIKAHIDKLSQILRTGNSGPAVQTSGIMGTVADVLKSFGMGGMASNMPSDQTIQQGITNIVNMPSVHQAFNQIMETVKTSTPETAVQKLAESLGDERVQTAIREVAEATGNSKDAEGFSNIAKAVNNSNFVQAANNLITAVAPAVGVPMNMSQIGKDFPKDVISPQNAISPQSVVSQNVTPFNNSPQTLPEDVKASSPEDVKAEKKD